VDLPRRAEVSRAANHRYLQAIASTQGNTSLAQAARSLTVPVRWQGHRYRAINPLAPPDGALLQALSRGEWAVTGFRNRDLCRCLYGAKPNDARGARRQSAAMSRRLRLLRAHGLIRKIPRTHAPLYPERTRPQFGDCSGGGATSRYSKAYGPCGMKIVACLIKTDR
jgi:hypothetical protein